jgi:hypothetical protein
MQIHSLKIYYITSISKIIFYKRSSLFCIVKQHWVVFVGQFFFKTLSIPSSRVKQLGPPLQIGLNGCPKMLVYNYQTTQCNNPEEQRLPLQHGRSLKSHTVWQKILGSHSMVAED